MSSRAEILICHTSRALYALCREVPPLTPVRPRRLRWILFDAGCYDEIRRAYAQGSDGRKLGWRETTVFAVAWLAGRDAAIAQARAA